MGTSENPIQSFLLQRLELLERQGKAYAFRSNSFSGRLVRWNGSTGVIKNNKRGLPDVVSVINGTFIGWECKSLKGRQSPEQKQAEQRIKEAGGMYAVVRTPEEVEAWLKKLL